MRGLTLFFAIAALIGLLGVALGQRYSEARFTDAGQSSSNTFTTKRLQPPTLTTAANGSVADLSWTNPDALSGPNASFAVERANGDCTAPGTFAAITGSPFAITALT